MCSPRSSGSGRFVCCSATSSRRRFLVREAQLAAALDVWERLPEAERTGARRDGTPAGINAAAVAGAATVTAPTPLARRRRGTSTRWLTGAAAALVLVLAGGVALQLGSKGRRGRRAHRPMPTKPPPPRR